jgi:hypothetical protein
MLLLLFVGVRKDLISPLPLVYFVSGKSMESNPMPSSANLVRVPHSPAPLARVSTVSTGFETCARAAGFQSANKVVPRFSQADCDGYDTKFGEPCCLVRIVMRLAVIMLPHYLDKDQTHILL